MFASSTFVYVNNLKCAAAILALGGKPRQTDFVTRVTKATETKETTSFWFEPITKKGEKVHDLAAAFSYLARGPKGPLRASTASILNNADHLIHFCFDVLKERDEIHTCFLSAMAAGDKLKPDPSQFRTSNTKIATMLVTNGFHMEDYGLNETGQCEYAFIPTPTLLQYVEAYESPELLLKDDDHKVYYAKACLEQREACLYWKNKATPYIYKMQAGKHLLIPTNATPETLAKCQAYL